MNPCNQHEYFVVLYVSLPFVIFMSYHNYMQSFCGKDITFNRSRCVFIVVCSPFVVRISLLIVQGVSL
jgi:hypothetical protein